MAVTLVKREYSNQFRAETTSWLLGNVGDIITLEMDFEVEIKAKSEFSSPFSSNGSDTFTREQGSWFDNGFAVGQTVNWTTSYNGTTQSGSGVISVVSNSVMILTSITGTFPSAFDYPSNTVSDSSTALTIDSATPIEGFELNYNLIANTDITSASLASLIDGTVLSLYTDTFDPTDTVTQTQLNPLNYWSGQSVFNAYIKGLGVTGITQGARVVIEFMITPLYGALSNFQTNTPPEFLAGAESLTDVFSTKFYPQIANPNVVIKSDSRDVALLGNVGWFNENYNGLDNDFSVQEIQYKDENNAVISSMQFNADTQIQVNLNDATAGASSKYKLGFALVPEDNGLYNSNQYYNHENIMYLGSVVIDTVTTSQVFTGFQNSTGAKVDFHFNNLVVNSNVVSIKGTFKPNSEFETYINSIPSVNWNYIAWVSLADPSLETGLSNRVSLLCDFNRLISEPVSFEAGNVDIEFLNHAQAKGTVGSSSYIGAVEDEILNDSLLFLNKSLNEKLQKVRFKIEGYNIVTGQSYTLENYEIDTANEPTDINGIQIINISTARGFNMADGVDKNLVEIIRKPSKDVGDLVAYDLNYAFRLRWEYWINNPSVPDALVEAGRQFNGKNQNWARLDSYLNDWKIRFVIENRLLRNGNEINTRNSANIFARTYEESDVWNGEITHFNVAGTNNLFIGLNPENIRQNAILDTQNTLVQADFDLEDLGGDVGNIADYYGVIRIEIYQEGGIFQIEMLSSILENKNEILKPVAGEAKCKIEKISATKIRLSGLIDYTYLTLGNIYKTSARIGYINEISEGIYDVEYDDEYA